DAGTYRIECGALQGEVAVEDLLGVFADVQLSEILQIRQAIEQQDALDQSIGVLHLADRLLVLDLLQPGQAPMPEDSRVNELLVDGGQFVLQLPVQPLDDSCVSFHAGLRQDQYRLSGRMNDG